MMRAMRNPDRGYAMIMFIGLMAIITLLTAVVVNSARADRTASRSLLTATEERSTISTALAEYYAALNSFSAEEQSFLLRDCQPDVDMDANTLGRNSTSVTSAKASLCEGWKTSALESCPDPGTVGADTTDVCFYLSTFPASAASDTSGASSLNVTVVDVTARTRCDTAGANCTYARYQQRLRRSQFFDFIFYNQYTTLDPQRYADFGVDPATIDPICGNRYGLRSRTLTPEERSALPAGSPDLTGAQPRSVTDPTGEFCLDVAYYGKPGRQDDINGPLYTNDDFILVCGNPLFQGTVYVSGQGISPNIYRSAQSNDPGCGTANPLFNGGADPEQSDLELPNYTNTVGSISTVATSEGLPILEAAGDNVVTLQMGVAPDGSASATQGRWRPNNGSDWRAVDTTRGLVYSPDDIHISGEVTGKISVFAAGDIRVVGDLTYAGADDNSNLRDVIALNAGGSIVIEEPIIPTQDRNLSAIMVSLQGAVYVDGWSEGNWTNRDNPATAPTDVPTLHFFGAMASKYQNVFGGYDSDQGFLVGGYLKDFEFDGRLRQNKITAPYLISPQETVWTRLDVAEVAACRGGNPAPGVDCS